MHDGSLATFYELPPAEDSFRDAVLAGLLRPRKQIPCRFLYDERGSVLFEQICELPEYYLTRTEIGILEARAGEIAGLIGPRCQLIEFGSGASRKIRPLLEALDRPAAYVPIDISREHLHAAAAELAAQFPNLAVAAVCADYTRPLHLPASLAGAGGRRVGFFPGSTIGNFAPDEAEAFLAGCRRVLGPGAEMLVGVDLKKEPETLDAAYNDDAGVTAAFNLNLLVRVNRELDANFDLDFFAHEAFYNTTEGRIEIYILSLTNQVVRVAGRRIHFAAGERIHTEDSYKYTTGEFHRLAARAGFGSVRTWTDEADLFSVHYLKARGSIG